MAPARTKPAPAASPTPARGHYEAFRDRLDLARQADALVAGRRIPIRTVPRAAVEALVARLTEQGLARV